MELMEFKKLLFLKAEEKGLKEYEIFTVRVKTLVLAFMREKLINTV